MCTASSRVPGGPRWMPISSLFCHAALPVSRQSCHRYSLYMETDTSRCGTWVYTTRTCMIDAKHFLPGWMWQKCALYRHLHCLGQKSHSECHRKASSRAVLYTQGQRWWSRMMSFSANGFVGEHQRQFFFSYTKKCQKMWGTDELLSHFSASQC